MIDRRTVIALGAAALATGRAPAAGCFVPAAGPLPRDWERAPLVPLWPGTAPGEGFAAQAVAADWPGAYLRNIARPQLRLVPPRQPNGAAVLIVPGGGYRLIGVIGEGIDVARRLAGLGYAAFVLAYRLPDEGWTPRADVPLWDAQRAMRVVRGQASRLGFAPDRVAVLGFSAGGHLAATLATAPEAPSYPPVDALDAADPRPCAAGLVYPVIAMEGPFAHAESRAALLGPSPSADLLRQRSPQLHAALAPPTFLVHAIDDSAVPVENSLMLLDALRRAGRPVEAHLLQEGDHAFALGCSATPSWEWPGLFHCWLQALLSSR